MSGAFIISSILLALLPWHAFLVTFTSHFLLNSNNDFLPKSSFLIAAWKEILIIILAILLIKKIFTEKKFSFNFVKFDYYFIGFFIIALFSALFITKNPAEILWGFKYDFSFFILFYLIRYFNFSKKEKNTLLKIFFYTSSSVIFLGVFTYFFLPTDFLTNLGYSDNFSSYSPEKPLTAYHQAGNFRRLASAFAGPNQLGFYLIIVISFLLPSINKKNFNKKILQLSFLSLSFIALFLTFSRAAWLGVILILFIFFKSFLIKYSRYAFILFSSLLFFISLLFFLKPEFIKQQVFRKKSSTIHYEKSLNSVKQIIKNPLGLGLAKAGPVTNRFPLEHATFVPKKLVSNLKQEGLSKTVIDEIWFYDSDYIFPNFITSEKYIRFKSFNIYELKNIPVFQNLPLNLQKKILKLWHENYQETIAENWHLQMFQEFGWLGGFFYLMLMGNIVFFLYQQKKSNIFTYGSFLSFCGALFAAMFLHVFEDSSSALTLFLLFGLNDFPRE